MASESIPETSKDFDVESPTLEIAGTSESVKTAIKSKSVENMPNNPSEMGWKASDIKKRFYLPIYDDKNSALAEINRVITEINDAFVKALAYIKEIEVAAATSDGGKVDKINEGGIIYGTKSDETPIGLQYSSNMIPWAIARYNAGNENDEGKATFKVGKPLTDDDATPKGYVNELINELIKGVSFTHKKGDVFNLTITTKGGETITTEVDLHLESLVTEVDDFKGEDDKYYLKLTFQNGTSKIYELDQIFAGVKDLLDDIKATIAEQSVEIEEKVNKIAYSEAKAQDKDAAVYAVTKDYEGNEVPLLVPVRRTSVPNTVVRRDKDSNVIVPEMTVSTPMDAAINKAALLNLNDYAINQSKAYIDEQITEAKQYSDDKLAPVENRVSALENTLLTLERDTSVAYAKAVPANSYPKAFLNSIGGMTYRIASNNLFPCPAEGIRLSLDNGSYIANYGSVILPAGTYSYSVDAVYDYEEEHFEYLGLAIAPDDGSDPSASTLSSPFTLTETTTVILIGTYFDEIYLGLGANVKLMLNKGSTVKTFEGYFPPYLEDTKVTEVISHGTNMFDIENAEIIGTIYIEASKNNNAVRCTLTRDTSANGWQFVKYYLSAKHSSIYVGATLNINGNQTQGCINLTLYDAATNTKVSNIHKDIFPKHGERGSVYVEIPEQYRSDNYYLLLLFYGCAGKQGYKGDYIEYSDIIISTAEVPYTPYREPIRYPIPAEIKAQMSGKGALDIQKNTNYYSDTANFDSGKYEYKMNTLILNGTENWKIENRPSKRDFNFYIDSPIGKFYTPVVSNYFESDIGRSTGMDNNMWISGTGKINCTAVGFASVDEWKAHLARLYASGNPVTITYALAEPTEEDLAAAFDKKIEVFPGGYLEFKNDKGNAVPSDVAFITNK